MLFYPFVFQIQLGNSYQQYGYQWHLENENPLVSYTDYVKPICLPCASHCVQRYLTSVGILTGNENNEEKCRIESSYCS